MYSDHIAHVMRHLWRMQVKVQDAIQDAPPGSRKLNDGLTFLAGLQEARKNMRDFWVVASSLDISGADYDR